MSRWRMPDAVPVRRQMHVLETMTSSHAQELLESIARASHILVAALQSSPCVVRFRAFQLSRLAFILKSDVVELVATQ